MKSSEKDYEQLYNKLKKRKKQIAIRAIFLALFVLGVNIYAWFVFVSQSDVVVEANVSSWNVTFLDDNVVIHDLAINKLMYPGMPDYNKTLAILNSGDTVGELEYTIENFKFLGTTYTVSNPTTFFQDMNSKYPFYQMVSVSGTIIPAGEMVNFYVQMKWNYEDDGTKPYYALTDVYEFKDDFVYYRKNGNDYVPDTTITASNFVANRSQLYIERDDADTYFGEACGTYEKTSNEPCISYNVHLVVSQVNN